MRVKVKKRETRRRVCQMKEAGHALSADICGVESPGVLTKNPIVNEGSLCQQSMVFYFLIIRPDKGFGHQ